MTFPIGGFKITSAASGNIDNPDGASPKAVQMLGVEREQKIPEHVEELTNTVLASVEADQTTTEDGSLPLSKQSQEVEHLSENTDKPAIEERRNSEHPLEQKIEKRVRFAGVDSEEISQNAVEHNTDEVNIYAENPLRINISAIRTEKKRLLTEGLIKTIGGIVGVVAGLVLTPFIVTTLPGAIITIESFKESKRGIYQLIAAKTLGKTQNETNQLLTQIKNEIEGDKLLKAFPKEREKLLNRFKKDEIDGGDYIRIQRAYIKEKEKPAYRREALIEKMSNINEFNRGLPEYHQFLELADRYPRATKENIVQLENAYDAFTNAFVQMQIRIDLAKQNQKLKKDDLSKAFQQIDTHRWLNEEQKEALLENYPKKNDGQREIPETVTEKELEDLKQAYIDVVVPVVKKGMNETIRKIEIDSSLTKEQKDKLLENYPKGNEGQRQIPSEMVKTGVLNALHDAYYEARNQNLRNLLNSEAASDEIAAQIMQSFE